MNSATSDGWYRPEEINREMSQTEGGELLVKVLEASENPDEYFAENFGLASENVKVIAELYAKGMVEGLEDDAQKVTIDLEEMVTVVISTMVLAVELVKWKEEEEELG